MKSLVLMCLSGLFLALSCDSYIENKRAGLRPYNADEDTKQAQEEKSSEK
jgi:hypothetical protein